jgi:Na+/pantothenate symporter
MRVEVVAVWVCSVLFSVLEGVFLLVICLYWRKEMRGKNGCGTSGNG